MPAPLSKSALGAPKKQTGGRSHPSRLNAEASALRHLPPHHPKQRRHRLLLPSLVRRLRLAAMLIRLLVPVVLELLLANGLLRFFRGHDGGGLALRASASRLAACGPPRRCAPPLLMRG